MQQLIKQQLYEKETSVNILFTRQKVTQWYLFICGQI